MGYKIICDDGCDLTKEMLENNHIIKIAMDVYIDENKYNEKDIILKKMKESKNAPKTACASIGEFLQELNNEDDIYIVTLSANVSGSYNAAFQAVEMFKEDNDNKNIHIFNSKSASSGETLIIKQIQENIEQNLQFNEVVKNVESFLEDTNTLFIFETLDTLIKNGRLTKVQGAITNLTNIKLICAANKNGEIINKGKALSMNMGIKKMVDFMNPILDNHKQTIIISHCNCLERAEKVRDLIKKKYNVNNIIIVETGIIATTYANEGGIIISY